MRAVIEMDGGLIRNVICDEPLEVLVIERDAEKAEGDEEGEKMSLHVKTMDADEDELTVETLFNRAMDEDEYNA